MTRRRERRRKPLLDNLKEKRGYSELKEEALYRTVWRACIGRDYGPVCTTGYGMNGWMDGWMDEWMDGWMNE